MDRTAAMASRRSACQKPCIFWWCDATDFFLELAGISGASYNNCAKICCLCGLFQTYSKEHVTYCYLLFAFWLVSLQIESLAPEMLAKYPWCVLGVLHIYALLRLKWWKRWKWYTTMKRPMKNFGHLGCLQESWYTQLIIYQPVLKCKVNV